MPKIGLYPDSKLSCLSIIQSQENRLSHRPISSAIGTGGLDFLIANALLILCHSLFKVVIREALERRKKDPLRAFPRDPPCSREHRCRLRHRSGRWGPHLRRQRQTFRASPHTLPAAAEARRRGKTGRSHKRQNGPPHLSGRCPDRRPGTRRG